MDDLRRELAPISTATWAAIDAEARDELGVILAGRRIVDLTGPLGWATSAIGLGRVQALSSVPYEGVRAGLRRAQRVVELRAPFELQRAELDALGRGAHTIDLGPLRRAASAIGMAEDGAIFHGYPDAEIEGIFTAAEAASLSLSRDYQKYPLVVSEALARLRTAGVGGPYVIALGPECYKGLTATATAGGYPVLEHVKQLIGGEILWAPGIRGAVVASRRGGDFELVVGRDLSIGYESHTPLTVALYLEESLTFRVHSPEAAVPLVYR
ncbi:MAG TPA: family 1 encapsulin nanocompartment shell protein [Polyangiaceae bacterium]|nr:family 1 encapsulin nanocompartment shell protein [Polyangiaceae bacterium]